MHLPVFLLGQLSGLNPLNPAPVERSTGLVFRDVALILVVVGALAALLFLWARVYMARKQGRRSSHAARSSGSQHRSSGRRENREDEEEGEERGDGRRRRRRRRRRSREHRPRNPTLAQTGGLPPPKGPVPGTSGT